jgi:adenylate cyclase
MMRQLAAILFADIHGYTALMQDDERSARMQRQRFKETLEAQVPKFHGKIVQFYGDGSLSIFHSAIDCVHAAIAIQLLLRASPEVRVRVGIHTGDVHIEDELVYGDGVNLAARVESLATPGSIFISEKVFDEIKNQNDILSHEIGYFEFKNVKTPVRIFAIANEGLAIPSRDELRGKLQPALNRLAVLPFTNMSSDADNEYFSDGITEELLNALAKIEEIKVTSRTSSFAFKGKNADIRDIAIQLNVDRVLEGSVRKAGNRVRITAQLINATDGYHIWSETYDRDLTDIFYVQEDISRIIANKLRSDFAAVHKSDTTSNGRPKNMLAYTYYLKGLHFYNKTTPADTREAIKYYDRAIEIEPGYAQAHAMAAWAYSLLGARGQMLPDKAFELVHRYANKAMELDNTVAESYVAKANVYLLYEWKWQQALIAAQRAIELNAASTEAYQLLAFYNVIMGDRHKAVELLEHAEQIDPLSPSVGLTLGSMYTFAHAYDKAINQANKVLEIHPDMRNAIELKAWATGMSGNWQEALQLFREVHRLTNHPLKGLMGMAYASGVLGKTDEALLCIKKMEERQHAEPDSVVDIDLAFAWLGLGDLEKTFYYINQCIDKRVGPISYILEYPLFERLKTDPRFRAAKKRMGL